MARRKTTRKEKMRQYEDQLMGFITEQQSPNAYNSSTSEVRVIMPRNPSQVDAMNYLRTKTLSILTGPPGTAKTLLATYVACEKLRSRSIDKVYYVKPVVDVPGEKGFGFLPGNLEEKVAPHIAPIRDALGVFMQAGKAEHLLSKKIIEFLPIDHLRGRSLHRCMVIADEMQNATTHSVMTILTRLGDHASMALLGDIVQRDLANKFGKDGLSDAARRLGPLPHVGVVEFGFEHIERSEFVTDVIKAYADLYKAH